MLSTTCFNMDQSKILSSGNGLKSNCVYCQVSMSRSNSLTYQGQTVRFLMIHLVIKSESRVSIAKVMIYRVNIKFSRPAGNKKNGQISMTWEKARKG